MFNEFYTNNSWLCDGFMHLLAMDVAETLHNKIVCLVCVLKPITSLTTFDSETSFLYLSFLVLVITPERI